MPTETERIKELERAVGKYEKILGIGDNDPVKNAFIVYVRMLNQQTEYLKDFTIKDIITKPDKDSPEYKRAMEMVGELPKMITSVDDLKSRLKLTRDDLNDIAPSNPVFAKITTPESMADSVGELAGMKK